jgi:four helix bundle protein
MRVSSYKDLVVWQRAIELVCAAYDVSRKLPPEERFALGDQIRRAAVSVPANVAEGHSRAGRREFLHFLAVSAASLTELETHLIIAERVGYVGSADVAKAWRIADGVGRMLTVMRKRLREGAAAAQRRYTPDAIR